MHSRVDALFAERMLDDRSNGFHSTNPKGRYTAKTLPTEIGIWARLKCTHRETYFPDCPALALNELPWVKKNRELIDNLFKADPLLDIGPLQSLSPFYTKR